MAESTELRSKLHSECSPLAPSPTLTIRVSKPQSCTRVKSVISTRSPLLAIHASVSLIFNSTYFLHTESLPYSIRVLLESAVRNCDDFSVKETDVEKILNWVENSQNDVEIPFRPARVILQDFTGVPAVVDLAAMRDAMKRLGGDPSKINPLVPVDLVIDHSVQVDSAGSADSARINE